MAGPFLYLGSFLGGNPNAFAASQFTHEKELPQSKNPNIGCVFPSGVITRIPISKLLLITTAGISTKQDVSAVHG
jgi:hypothetical protein